MSAQDLNRDLIGVKGGRALLATPALIVDLNSLEKNIGDMATHARESGIALRPHAKTHKCSEIAKRQIAAGGLGICCAKLGEAEALAAAGIDSILVTSPVVTERGIPRVIALNARIAELLIASDNASVATRLAEAAGMSGKRLRVVVDIDPGLGRTGMRPGAEALALVEQIVRSETLVFAGLQCYAGNVQHIESPEERRNASLRALKELAELRDRLLARGVSTPRLSGGGTGTFDIDPEARTLTELQVGSYVFMDQQYKAVWEHAGRRPPFETSLFVQTTVISANREGRATTDAGLKAFATDAGPPVIVDGAPAGASYAFFGDEQGLITYQPSLGKLEVGAVVTCIVPHCDPTVNLYDCYHCVRGDILEAIWPIEARGRSA